jgi:DnaK suppressor protein
MATKGKSTSKLAPAKKGAKPAAKKAVPAKKPAPKAPAAKKPVAKPAVKAAPKAVAKPAAKPAAKPVAKPAPKAIQKPVPTKTVPKATPVKVNAKDDKKDERKPVKASSNASSLTSGVLPPDYDPVKDKGEFMNPVMREFFRQKLISWREELLRESSETIHNTLQGTELQKPDMADRASAETDHALELRTRDRERKLISKINEALLRIEDSTYGYCEETGEPITVARLVARPTATLSIEAQERHERMEKTHRDD